MVASRNIVGTAVVKPALLALCALSALLISARPSSAQTGDVPVSYQPLYARMQGDLDTLRGQVDSRPDAGIPLTIAAELLPANANRGPALLDPATLAVTTAVLDRFQELGIQGVTIPLKFPLYTPSFPNYAGYVQFYQQVGAEIRKRGMKLDVEASVIFANTPFSPVTYDFSQLTFDQFELQMRQMTQAIINDLAPDYLTLIGEPSTETNLSGFAQLDDPAGCTAYIQFLLDGLNRGTTLVGAGSGNWDSPAFAQSFAVNTSLDYIDLHIYPVSPPTMANAAAVISAARQNGKRPVLDEAWLYKSDQPAGGNNVAASTNVFKRDAYSFWSPLDQELLHDVVQLARVSGIEFVSAFWSGYFFSYLDYTPALDSASYGQVTQQANQRQFAAIQTDQFSETGRYLQQMTAAIAGGGKLP